MCCCLGARASLSLSAAAAAPAPAPAPAPHAVTALAPRALCRRSVVSLVEHRAMRVVVRRVCVRVCWWRSLRARLRVLRAEHPHTSLAREPCSAHTLQPHRTLLELQQSRPRSLAAQDRDVCVVIRGHTTCQHPSARLAPPRPAYPSALRARPSRLQRTSSTHPAGASTPGAARSAHAGRQRAPHNTHTHGVLLRALPLPRRQHGLVVVGAALRLGAQGGRAPPPAATRRELAPQQRHRALVRCRPRRQHAGHHARRGHRRALV